MFSVRFSVISSIEPRSSEARAFSKPGKRKDNDNITNITLSGIVLLIISSYDDACIVLIIFTTLHTFFPSLSRYIESRIEPAIMNLIPLLRSDGIVSIDILIAKKLEPFITQSY